jgi:hypothetical protein
LGVPARKPQVGAQNRPLTWGFAAVGGHLLPRFGIDWSAEADDHLVARYRIDDVDLEVHCRLDGEGRLQSVAFDRWGDPGWRRPTGCRRR